MSGALAQRLLEVRAGAPLLEDVAPEDRPPDLAAAYAVADAVVDVLATRDGPVAGYKVGATSAAGQRLLGLAEPFYGRIPARRVFAAGAVALGGDPRACTVEAEVGFLIGTDLPPRERPYDAGEVAAAIQSVVPLFEVNRPSYARPFEVGGLCLIADNGVTQGLVVGGPGVTFGAAPRLADETVQMLRNGVDCAQGSASGVLGDPVRAVVWLANALRARGQGLRAGQVVASGAMTPPVPVAPGDRFAAEYATLGRTEFVIEAGSPAGSAGQVMGWSGEVIGRSGGHDRQ